jgi:hypothetical protein
MRPRTALLLALALLLAAPAGAPALQAGDEQLEREAATLPRELWEPAPEPVSAAGPGLPEAARVAPLLAMLLFVGAAGAGYAVSVLRPASATATAAPGPELPLVHPPAAAHETCAISLARARGRGHFEVRIGSRVVASSLPFAAPRGQPVEPTGAAGRAHRRLLVHLVAAGWQLEPAGDAPWYERRLTRPLGAPGGDVDRALVATRPEGEESEFVALALDEYGNAHVMARSPRFRGRADRPVAKKGPAAKAHAALLGELESDGWHVEGTLETWYGATLARRRG